MRALFTRKTLIVIIAAVLVAAIAIISLNTNGSAGVVTNSVNAAMGPLRRVASSVANTFENIYGYMYDYDNVVKENESLKAQIAKLTQDYTDSADISAENDRLHTLLGLSQRHPDWVFDTSSIMSITSWTSSNWASSFTIDKGSSNSNIAAGNSVITASGLLVGRVTAVGTATSTVTTVLDTTFSAGVLIGQSGSPGVVNGDFSLMSQGLCKIDNITDDVDILAGDTVVTSGSGGVFPKGLTIGNVESVQRNATGMDRYATVRPAVDFKNLTDVYLITSFEPAD